MLFIKDFYINILDNLNFIEETEEEVFFEVEDKFNRRTFKLI